MVTSGSIAWRLVGFAVALATAFATMTIHQTPTQALVWLPSGVAITGLFVLGWRAVWLVAVATLTYLLLANHPMQLALIGALGSSAEALLGCWLLKALRMRQGCARLYDVVAIYVMALAAPIAAMACIVFGRLMMAGPQAESPFTGMAGWWRMNTIAILITVPLAVSWPILQHRRDHLRPIGRACFWGGLAGLLAVTVMLVATPSVSSIFLLGVLPMIALAAALDIGNRGSSTVCFLSVLCIALPAGVGVGVFEAIDPSERRIVTQILLAGVAALSPLFGALLAERDTNAARLLQTEGAGNALLRLLPDATYRLSPDGYVLDAVLPKDPALPDADELIGKHIREITQPYIAKQLLQQLQLLHDGKPTETTEYSLETPLGRRDREVRFIMLPNGEAMSVARDITERKRAERQLELQASILEMIASGEPRNSVFHALVQGVETLIPDGKCSILLRHGDRLHMACSQSLPDEYKELIDGLPVGVNNGACGTAAATGKTVIAADTLNDPRTAAYVDIAKQFGLRACWSVPIPSADGTMLGTLAVYHHCVREPQPFEIHAVERAAVLAGLMIDNERREALLASIHKNVNEGLFRCMPGDDFAYVNASFAHMLGYESPDELLATWRTGANADHIDALEQLTTETSSLRSHKMQLPRRDGSRFWALISTSVTFDDNDAELICDGTITDITSFKELEDQLRQAQKMEAVGQLAGGVAHDFNNLLTAISGFSETIDAQLPPASEARSDVIQIREACKRAAGLTRQLLAFGRQQVLNPEVLELPNVIDNVRDMVDRLIGGHIEVVIEPHQSSVRAKADRGQLEQVILNLVINARDAMPNGGTVTVTASAIELPEHNLHPDLPAGRYAVLQVRDTGTGMTPEVQARAFDPFYTTKAVGVGTGLGLATVYGIVKQSNGDIVIDSTIGAGTCMSVYLPFESELPTAEPTVTVPRPEARHGTILVVEDERVVLELTERVLVTAGHKVLSAADGIEALQVYSEHHDQIDLVVTDIVMPNMGGAELVAELHASQPNLPILYMSGYAPDSIELPSNSLRVAFLDKPFSTRQLTDQVGRMLNHGASGAAPRAAETM